ncbi:transcriptional regulator, HxlR family [Aliiroseovarius halocynthiae]|uniref:Helix-turn-helix transcriptional regulator n=1 Tax=Aliiroseovarius halocynthiae TaxID=985055 RepID=A0A545SYD2_9RHOB|nr:helix-turn-helix domain-containing protein [Aliiroseovarius halocynthiae]TQV69970.1 helix-turn-helix transcriptional regulator [Aliiroseovarius halocynthiae]SMR70634.1 transcriptional regulator, HxlR family [Aliiroseovarius halocynthiae]
MSRAKPYSLSCPISLSLDLLGNRWALHVLRELHAGPSGFGMLRDGLPGIATNMLSARLAELVEGGLVSKSGRIYALTERGQATRGILFELARFGRDIPTPENAVQTGFPSSRIAILTGAIERAAGPLDELRAEIWLDETPFTLIISQGQAAMIAGPMPLAPVRLGFSWRDLEAVARGDQRLANFAAQGEIIAQDPLLVAALLDLLQKAMDIYGGFK